MSRNISAVVDDEVARFIDQEREKRGVMKSKAINLLIREKMMTDPENAIKDLEGKVQENKRVLEKSEAARRNLLTREGEITDQMIDIIDDNEPTIYDTYPELKREKVSTEAKPERKTEKYIVRKPEIKTGEGVKINTTVTTSSIPDIPKVELPKIELPKIELPKVEIPKVESPKVEIPKVEASPKKQEIILKVEPPKTIEPEPIKITKELEALKELSKLNPNQSNNTRKVKLTERKRMNDEDVNINTGRKETTEEAIKKYLEKQEFDKNFKEMHSNIKDINERVCKDGECTKRELLELRGDVKGLNNLKSELDKDLSKLDEIDNLKNDLKDIKGKLTKKTVICPNCGFTDVPHLASYCPDCGSEFHAWTDDDTGNLISNWKPYKERNKK